MNRKQQMHDSLPFLTADIAGIGGVIKTRPEDFFVEELPLYEASGSGTHVYAQIEKKGLGTREALDRIARALNASRRDIGLAGLKDAHAVARQWISIEHIEPQRVEQVAIPDVRILQTTRHTNKLKPGHLRGNRFVVRLRKLALPLPQATETAQNVLSTLGRRGVPNYFGPQRFGNHGDNHLLGKAVVQNDAAAFAGLFLGHPNGDIDSPAVLEARRLYDEGRYEEAARAWPGSFFDQRRALRAMIAGKGNKKKVFYTVDKHLKGLFVSAYQSDLFNRVLLARMPDIDKMLLGDMAYKHANGACFRVEQPQVEQPRCESFEISPTGPLLGERTTRLTGPAGEIENPILDGENLSDLDMRQMKHFGSRGGRRPLRFQPRNASVTSGQDDLGPYLELAFELDSGCYATALLAELTKDRATEAPEPEE
ncbi:MAG: tRNA pseudouridine(13) synthase TruD [Sedimentisphaerales bacterium]|nr:tRNA pseudouridine(13) synthase TruD [Sedimentisphaerales bacterium]